MKENNKFNVTSGARGEEIISGDGSPRGLVIAVSAPSGTGKTTLCNMLTSEFKDIKPSVSYTTRQKRPGEKDGISYNFVSDSVFEEMIERNEFLEWANVFGKRYGTSYGSVMAGLGNGSAGNDVFDVLLEIDVQGVENLIRYFKRSGDAGRLVTIFITPPSYGELIRRLSKRGDVDEEALNKRSEGARIEIERSRIYDYTVTNDDLNLAFLKLKSIIIAERCKNIDKIQL